jgi:hypothetical protein
MTSENSAYLGDLSFDFLRILKKKSIWGLLVFIKKHDFFSFFLGSSPFSEEVMTFVKCTVW